MFCIRSRPASRRSRTPRSLAALGAAAALVATAVTAAGSGSAPASAAEGPAAALTVRLDPSYQHPAFEGWGTALAWFANVTGGWPDAQRNALADALYGADGLGFTIARYNIGGGDSPETTPYMRPGAAVPGYWNRPGPEAPDWWDPNRADHWNPGADASQCWWLTAAKARGAKTFEAFSNSAPYFMTNSGLVSGAANGRQDNLRADQYDRFAAYLTGALQRAQSASGVTFDSVSPVNEPDTDYWHAGGRQEGSHWDPASQARMITTLRAALDAKGVKTPIAAMDETNPEKFRSDWESYAPEVRAAVGRLNTHTYGTNGRTGARDTAKGEAAPLWMSEVDTGGSAPQSFTDMSPALDLARHINDDIRELEPSAWVLWQAVEDYENMTPGHENSNWGLIQTDFTPENAATEPLRKNKKYWAMANYSRFVRPGARIVDTDDPQTLAAVRPGGDGVVVVPVATVNGTSAPVQRTSAPADTAQQWTFTKLSATDWSSTAAYRVTNAKTGKALAVSGGTLTFAAPGASTAQQWIRSTTGDGHHTLVNAASGTLLDVTGASTDDGAPVGVYRPTAGANQSWTFPVAAADTWKTLAFRHSSRCLDVSGAGSGDGAAVVQYGCNAGTNQQWSLRSTGNGYVNVVARHSGKCLDVSDVSTADGAVVLQYACNGGRNQEWAVRGTGDGYLTLTARHSAKCLGVDGAATTDGAAVVQRACDGTGAQQLRLG
ncbi:RICIN domain-containing protein [Streptomyces sp. OR43]|uniref:RICIN domain-containing protein n=1 Tax=Streptomyces sp. or43 TaxID=2478957 RepID=UPI0011CEAB8D|nr:RICIN domain-containing protein [Streptomyces sp. or43]TXS39126.1 hypothetical protein EAO72_39280 [Streptomyces sp. or43]